MYTVETGNFVKKYFSIPLRPRMFFVDEWVVMKIGKISTHYQNKKKQFGFIKLKKYIYFSTNLNIYTIASCLVF